MLILSPVQTGIVELTLHQIPAQADKELQHKMLQIYVQYVFHLLVLCLYMRTAEKVCVHTFTL